MAVTGGAPSGLYSSLVGLEQALPRSCLDGSRSAGTPLLLRYLPNYWGWLSVSCNFSILFDRIRHTQCLPQQPGNAV
jgi:hypothetical protein